jgi:hypothetical protein
MVAGSGTILSNVPGSLHENAVPRYFVSVSAVDAFDVLRLWNAKKRFYFIVPATLVVTRIHRGATGAKRSMGQSMSASRSGLLGLFVVCISVCAV